MAGSSSSKKSGLDFFFLVLPPSELSSFSPTMAGSLSHVEKWLLAAPESHPYFVFIYKSPGSFNGTYPHPFMYILSNGRAE